MIVVCPSCSSRFQYPEDRFQGVVSKRFKCPKCAFVFEVLNPEFPKLPGTDLPGSGLPEPSPPEPGQPGPGPSEPAPATPRPAMTTARKKRDAMLAAAGLGPGDMPPDLRFSLAFLTGPLASTVRVLESALTTIGREEGDVIINDPEASRRHARIEIHPDGSAWLSDLGSTNGTSTLGRTIDGPTQLFDRQEFTCGRSTFMLLIRSIDTLSPD
jgi:pSer/pThr/pTyr-binding forkhead associated (FHA) protein